MVSSWPVTSRDASVSVLRSHSLSHMETLVCPRERFESRRTLNDLLLRGENLPPQWSETRQSDQRASRRFSRRSIPIVTRLQTSTFSFAMTSLKYLHGTDAPIPKG